MSLEWIGLVGGKTRPGSTGLESITGVWVPALNPRHQGVKRTVVESAQACRHQLGRVLGEAVSTHNCVIVVHPDEDGGYWTDAPSLPGCGSQGDTVDEAVEMTKDAILGYLESLKKHGNPPPSDSAIVVTVTIAA